MAHTREEVAAAVDHYVEVRRAVDAGEATWGALAELFTDDAVFIDPAWGRVEGIEEMRRTVFGDAMVGFEDWKFPIDFTAIDGDNVVIKWTQVLPGQRENGRPYAQSGCSTLVYAGDGKFSYEEDLLNMVHVLEDMREQGAGARRCDATAPPEPRLLAADTSFVTDQDTADYVAIQRLHSAYADAVNMRSWPRLAELFAPDAPVSVDTVTRPATSLVGGAAVAEFISGAIERFEFFEFVTLNASIRLAVDGDTEHAVARLFMCELRQERESGEFSRAFGVYHDDYRRGSQGWRFARRRYQSLARTGGEVFAVPTVAGFDDPPPAAATAPLSAALVGTWELLSRADHTSAGEERVDPLLGSDPVALLIYDRAGHFAAQFMKRDRTEVTDTPTAPDASNNTRAQGGYDAYFGQYTVDDEHSTVTQTLDAALSAANVGQTLTREMHVDGDALTIRLATTAVDGTPVTRTLTWRRVG